MSHPIRILILEDLLSDALLAERELRRSLNNFVIRIVDTEISFREELRALQPDIIISDYKLPSFDGLSALKLAGEITPDTPFIIMTGSMNEDTAVSCLRAGAADYVIKEHLKRLGPAVINALEQKKAKIEKRKALELMESRETMYRLMFARNPQPMFIYDCKSLLILEVNQSALTLYGYSEEEFLSLTIKDIRPPEDIPELLKIVEKPREDYYPAQEWRHLKKSGELINVEIISHGILFNERAARHVLVKDITRQKKSEEALSINEKKYRAFFENSFDAILLANPDGSVYEANPAACQLFGYSAMEFLQLKMQDLVDTNDANLETLLSERERLGKALGELFFIRKNGSRFSAEVSSAMFEDAKKVLRTSLIIRDVTERKNNEEALRKSEEALIQDLAEKKKLIDELVAAKNKADEIDKLKTAFLQNISHEIRTPLNAIVGFCSFLGDPQLEPEKRQHFLNIIDASSNQLLSIISSIISLAALEAGHEQLQEKECHLNELLMNIYEQFKVTAVSPEINFSCKTGLPDGKDRIMVDSVKLMQVLVNLIGNSFKFTARGNISYGYNIRDKWIEFFVKDTGIGIPPEMHEAIFERFRQVDNSPTRKYGGAGLGLALSKGYVEMMGGKLKVNSEPGKGSLFSFTLPYQKTN